MRLKASSANDCLTSNGISWYFSEGDVLDYLWSLPAQSVDLSFGSPPYETRRPYSCGFSLKGEAWVSWMVKVYRAALRVCRGLVAFVVDGTTERFRYSAVPALLMADLHRKGICLRKPPVYFRRGIFGGGGTDWWRNDWEFMCVPPMGASCRGRTIRHAGTRQGGRLVGNLVTDLRTGRVLTGASRTMSLTTSMVAAPNCMCLLSSPIRAM